MPKMQEHIILGTVQSDATLVSTSVIEAGPAAFVVGWQSTVFVDGKPKNVRLGVRCDLAAARWELTEAI